MRTINLVAVLMLASAPLVANAADGTITFTGTISASTCTIVTQGGSADQSVTLPTVASGSLPAEGATAGRTPFSINLTGCTAGDVAAYFEPGSTVDFNTGRLLNQASTTPAGNVQIQLLGSNSEFLPVLAAGVGGAQTNSQWVTVAPDGSANLNYFAEYYATAPAGAGEVSTSVKYTLIYN